MTMGEDDTSQQGAAGHPALTTLQPIRDLAKNWDIDIASWYVWNVLLDQFLPFAFHQNLVFGICILWIRVRQIYPK
jgi:hypothetical protein